MKPLHIEAKTVTAPSVGSGDLLADGLSKTQRELYVAMKAGAICHHMPYRGRFNPNAYYFRSDTMKRCTAAAEALLRRGLVERYDEDWRGHKLRVSANTKSSHGAAQP